MVIQRIPKTVYILGSIAGIILVAALLSIYISKTHKTRVYLGNTEVIVTVADTPDKRSLGLGQRNSLNSDEGMFFVFENAQPYGFWMKDMRFPIDIIWFDANRRIIFVKENAEPSSYPDVFTPNSAAPFVLEVPAGFFSLHHLKVGDLFEISR